jgi:hypothetical protein
MRVVGGQTLPGGEVNRVGDKVDEPLHHRRYGVREPGQQGDSAQVATNSPSATDEVSLVDLADTSGAWIVS